MGTEYQLNQYSTCAYAKLPTDDLKMKFLHCVENNPYTTWMKWFLQSIGADPQPVLTCYGSAEGNRLQKEEGDKTRSLHPRLHYVPWIQVDGDSSQQETVRSEVLAVGRLRVARRVPAVL